MAVRRRRIMIGWSQIEADALAATICRFRELLEWLKETQAKPATAARWKVLVEHLEEAGKQGDPYDFLATTPLPDQAVRRSRSTEEAW
jgi:hypothetical protein